MSICFKIFEKATKQIWNICKRGVGFHPSVSQNVRSGDVKGGCGEAVLPSPFSQFKVERIIPLVRG